MPVLVFWRDAGVAELARLESVCTSKGYRGFESLSLRLHKTFSKFKTNNNPFELAENGVTSKPSLAIEILMNSKEDATGNEFSNWQIPAYIEEGLLWLK